MLELFAYLAAVAVERSQSVLALRATERRLSSVLEHVPVVIITVDRHGIVTSVMGGGVSALGWDPGAVIGQTIHALCAGQTDVLDAFARALGGEKQQGVVQVHGLAYQLQWLPSFDTKGQLTRVNGIALDITERARAQAQAENLARIRSDFVASVSHELRTPLSAIIGYGELLEQHWSELDDVQRRVYVQRGVLAAQRQQRLVEDLLLLSKLDAEKPVTSIEPFYLDDVIRRAIGETEGYHGKGRFQADG